MDINSYINKDRDVIRDSVGSLGLKTGFWSAGSPTALRWTLFSLMDPTPIPTCEMQLGTGDTG